MGGEVAVVIVVVLVAGVAHGLVLRFDLLHGLAIPLDGGRCFRGRRLFGDNKTLRGVVVMVVASAVAGAVLFRLVPPGPRPGYGWSGLGALVGLAYVVAELPNSFLKRQMGIAPGVERGGVAGAVQHLVDEADSVIGVVLLLWWQVGMAGVELLALLVVGTAVHFAFDALLRRVGAKVVTTPPAPGPTSGPQPSPGAPGCPDPTGGSPPPP